MKKLNFLFLTLAMIMAACEKDPVSSETGVSTLSLKAQYINTSTTGQPMSFYKSSLVANAITITRARFLIRNVKLRSAPEDSMEFISDPYIIDLNLDGQPNTIVVKDIPANTYDRIEFRVHRLDDDDPRDLAYFQHPDFQDFVEDNRYSMIIEGTIQEGTNSPETFVFRSRDNEEQRHFFNPVLVVDESTSQITVVFEINGTNWFVGEDGLLLDPRDESNEDTISDNLRESIEIVEKKSVNDVNDDDSYMGDEDTY
jgi:hypothetical protein